jgi:hypothetical protein
VLGAKRLFHLSKIAKYIEFRACFSTPDLHEHQPLDSKPGSLKVIASGGSSLNLNRHNFGDIEFAVCEKVYSTVICGIRNMRSSSQKLRCDERLTSFASKCRKRVFGVIHIG